LLLEVARGLTDHPARPVFVLAGAAENRPDLAPHGLVDNVLLTGALTEDELQDAYAAAAALVLPSFAESMPLVVLDALAFGLPVVISRACNLAEVERAGAGILVDAELTSLRAGVERLLACREDWAKMGALGQQLVAERYSSDRVHDQYERLYEELLRA
jgi:glycosyltransferase involved in cell wall biosynthesis